MESALSSAGIRFIFLSVAAASVGAAFGVAFAGLAAAIGGITGSTDCSPNSIPRGLLLDAFGPGRLCMRETGVIPCLAMRGEDTLVPVAACLAGGALKSVPNGRSDDEATGGGDFASGGSKPFVSGAFQFFGNTEPACWPVPEAGLKRVPSGRSERGEVADWFCCVLTACCVWRF